MPPRDALSRHAILANCGKADAAQHRKEQLKAISAMEGFHVRSCTEEHAHARTIMRGLFRDVYRKYASSVKFTEAESSFLQRILTARAASSATVANEISACTIISTLAHRERTGTSVGENAVLVLKARNR